jgi:spermidine/putrescine transport system substrate-binding protein
MYTLNSSNNRLMSGCTWGKYLAKLIGAILLSINLLLSGCVRSGALDTPTPLAPELILYAWPGYLPQPVLDAFTAEYGVPVVYQTYASQEEAEVQLRSGGSYDLVVLESEFLPRLIQANLLARINYQNIPNFKNISPNFRDLTYDPENRHSIPFHWGTTGLLVRTDLVKFSLRRWADLWDPRLSGQVALWDIPRDIVSIALKSLGYSINTENPKQLDQAVAHILSLKPKVKLVAGEEPGLLSLLASGMVSVAFVRTTDALQARQLMVPLQYIIPEEGTFLWSDHFVIPVSSLHKHTAELFLNFLLRPEISAQIISASYSPIPNDAASSYLPATLLSDALIFPPEQALRNAEILMPLSPEGDMLYDQIWERYLTADWGIK